MPQGKHSHHLDGQLSAAKILPLSCHYMRWHAFRPAFLKNGFRDAAAQSRCGPIPLPAPFAQQGEEPVCFQGAEGLPALTLVASDRFANSSYHPATRLSHSLTPSLGAAPRAVFCPQGPLPSSKVVPATMSKGDRQKV